MTRHHRERVQLVVVSALLLTPLALFFYLRDRPGLDRSYRIPVEHFYVVSATSLAALTLAILVGIDKFMSECRALTNLVGNGVATVVISRWEGELDTAKLDQVMAHPIKVGEELEPTPA